MALSRLKLGNQSGAAIDHLREGYTSDVRRTISGQYAMAKTAGAAVAAESVAWANTYDNLHKFIKNVTADFKSLAESTPGSSSGTELTAISAILTFTAGVVPPAAAALTAAAGLTALGSVIFPNKPQRTPEKLVLKGESFNEYLGSFEEGIRRIDGELRVAEQAIAEACSAQVRDFDDKGDNYSITLKRQEPLDNLGPFYSGTIDLDPQRLTRIAASIEVIGDQQNAVAKRLSGVRAAGGDGRGALPVSPPHRLGRCTRPVRQSGRSLTDILFNDQHVAHRVADHCIDIARDFRDTDRDRKNILDRATARLIGTPAPEVGHYNDKGAIVLPQVDDR